MSNRAEAIEFVREFKSRNDYDMSAAFEDGLARAVEDLLDEFAEEHEEDLKEERKEAKILGETLDAMEVECGKLRKKLDAMPVVKQGRRLSRPARQKKWRGEPDD